MMRLRMVLAVLAAWSGAAGWAAARVLMEPDWQRLPPNLARTAEIAANNAADIPNYGPQLVANDSVGTPGGYNRPGNSWVVADATYYNHGELTLTWPAPQLVAEIVAYNRSDFFSDCMWRDYELYLDEAAEPVVTGTLQRAAGPQRLPLPGPVQARQLKLRFTSTWGWQPGLSELLVHAEPAPPGALGKLYPQPTACLVTIPIDWHDGPHATLRRTAASRALEQDLLGGRLGFDELVVIRRRPLSPSHVYTYHYEGFQPGGGLYLLRPDPDGGQVRELVASPEGQILDCDVSWDGTEILFSWRRHGQATYDIFKIRTDGTGLVQLTDDEYYNFNACWLPDGDIAFLSTRKPGYAYCWISPVGVLHRMRPDGTGITQLSANYLNDFTPAVLSDGRLIYSRWEYVDRPAVPIQSLWTINPDGTGLAGHYGNRVLSPATLMEPRPVPGTEQVMCLLTAHNGPCRGGVGLIDLRHGLNAPESLRNLTPEVELGPLTAGDGNHVHGLYENPYPLDDDLFLVSYFGSILLRDFDEHRFVVVREREPGSELGWFAPQPLRTRSRPAPIPSMLPDAAEAEPWATVFLQDVYRGLEPEVQRGEVTHIAVVQELEKPAYADAQQRAFGFQFPVVSCGATYAPKRLWGYAPVAADGSATFQVPARAPVYFMALDKHGRALQRMRTFTHLMPGERQSCIGCHEPRDQAAPMKQRPLAMGMTPQKVRPPEWGVRGFSFAHIVQPVLDRQCVSCHGADNPAGGLELSGDKTDFFNVAYEHLARRGTVAEDWEMGGCPGGTVWQFSPYTRWIYTMNGAEQNILKIRPRTWGSPASKLADVVLSGHPDEDGQPRLDMTDAERRRIFAWIDLNVPYYPVSLSYHPERPGCRRFYPAQLDAVLQEVGQRRCAACHGTNPAGNVQIPRTFWTRIERPELNTFLTAPLAAEAGGTQRCGEVVFATPADPDYQRILATFAETASLMQERPRMDMRADPEETPPAACGRDAVAQK